MPYKILIADDHDIIREGIKNILRNQAAYEIAGEAQDGEEVLEKVASLKPDILLLDITMPKKSGLEIISQIQRLSKKTSILIISVHKADAYVMQALKAGVRGYLNKENAADDLLPALRKITAGQIYLSADVSTYLLEKASKSPQELAKEKILSEREEQVLRLVAEGKTAKEIADALFISARTAENYKNNILKKLGLHKTSDLIKYAIKNKIVDIEGF
ncbi:MAG: response regulator transcription factor [Candidatus Omnitrophica bacterium]|nr:response regulator transcription factor [Candidatus Omnitrophota bacterium]